MSNFSEKEIELMIENSNLEIEKRITNAVDKAIGKAVDRAVNGKVNKMRGELSSLQEDLKPVIEWHQRVKIGNKIFMWSIGMITTVGGLWLTLKDIFIK